MADPKADWWADLWVSGRVSPMAETTACWRVALWDAKTVAQKAAQKVPSWAEHSAELSVAGTAGTTGRCWAASRAGPTAYPMVVSRADYSAGSTAASSASRKVDSSGGKKVDCSAAMRAQPVACSKVSKMVDWWVAKKAVHLADLTGEHSAARRAGHWDVCWAAYLADWSGV